MTAAEAWRRPWPDLTTEAIERIDRELAKTERHRALLAQAVCMTCGERRLPHAHWTSA